MRAPDLTQRIIGFREWTTDGQFLYPTNSSITTKPWVKGVNLAMCGKKVGGYNIPCIPAVRSGCECGLYLRHDYDTVGGFGGRIKGIVAAWGRMQVHVDGFRTQYAEIIGVVNDGGLLPEVLRKIARAYGVPIVPRENVQVFAEEHGTPMPEQFIPKPSHNAEDDELLTLPTPIGIWSDLVGIVREVIQEKWELSEEDQLLVPAVEWTLRPLVTVDVGTLWDVLTGQDEIATPEIIMEEAAKVVPYIIEDPVTEAQRFLSPRGVICWVQKRS